MIEKNYESIDLVRIVMSVFVVAIHTMYRLNYDVNYFNKHE